MSSRGKVRARWTEREIRALVQGIIKYGKRWHDIKHDSTFGPILAKRSVRNLYDAWTPKTNIYKKYIQTVRDIRRDRLADYAPRMRERGEDDSSEQTPYSQHGEEDGTQSDDDEFHEIARMRAGVTPIIHAITDLLPIQLRYVNVQVENVPTHLPVKPIEGSRLLITVKLPNRVEFSITSAPLNVLHTLESHYSDEHPHGYIHLTIHY